VLWSGAFFFSEVALGELRPFTVVLVRFGAAAIAMLLVVRVSGHRMPGSGRTWVGFLVLGALNSFVPFSLIAWGQVHLTSGLASILNATTPLFTAVVAHAWGQERLVAHRVGGVLLGLAGVAVLIGPGALRHLGASTLGELAIVGAAIFYAFAGTYGRRFRAMPAVVPVAVMLTTSALLALPRALVLDHPWAARPAVPTAGALLLHEPGGGPRARGHGAGLQRAPRDRRAGLAAPAPSAQATAARSTGGRNSGITFSAKRRRLCIAFSWP
jgi:drug/metabolite transporter (DMT)-like permease